MWQVVDINSGDILAVVDNKLSAEKVRQAIIACYKFLEFRDLVIIKR